MENNYSIVIRKNRLKWLEWSEFTKACKNLTSSALKVYIFLCAEEDDSEVIYSPKKLQEDLGISTSSSHRAFSELREKGYLKEKGKNYYFFFP